MPGDGVPSDVWPCVMVIWQLGLPGLRQTGQHDVALARAACAEVMRIWTSPLMMLEAGT